MQFLVVAEMFGLVTFQDDAGAAWSVRVVRRMVSWRDHFVVCRSGRGSGYILKDQCFLLAMDFEELQATKSIKII